MKKLVPYILTLMLTILVVGLIDIVQIDNWIFQTLLNYKYDIPFWSVVEVIGVIGSVIIAFIAVNQSNENLSQQLEIEQTPYVVGKGAIFDNTASNSQVTYLQHCLYLKNIGRGMAKNITLSIVEDWVQDKRQPLFSALESHSIDLGSNQDSEPWLIHIPHLENAIKDKGGNFCIYIYYEDQLGNNYKTKLHLCRVSDRYKVMSNTVEVQ